LPGATLATYEPMKHQSPPAGHIRRQVRKWVMAGNADNPARQLAAAWQAAAAALGEWRQNVAAATAEARGKLDPAVRAALEAGRAALAGDWRACRCPCGTAHPDDSGVCDGSAVLTRRLGEVDVSLCAPCAVAQGVAEMPH
jgi:hypothetical protein